MHALRCGLRQSTIALLVAAVIAAGTCGAAIGDEQPAQVVRGTVVDASGAPAAGAKVALLYSKSAVETQADQSGSFALEVAVERLAGRMLVARLDDGAVNSPSTGSCPAGHTTLIWRYGVQTEGRAAGARWIP